MWVTSVHLFYIITIFFHEMFCLPLVNGEEDFLFTLLKLSDFRALFRNQTTALGIGNQIVHEYYFRPNFGPKQLLLHAPGVSSSNKETEDYRQHFGQSETRMNFEHIIIKF